MRILLCVDWGRGSLPVVVLWKSIVTQVWVSCRDTIKYYSFILIWCGRTIWSESVEWVVMCIYMSSIGMIIIHVIEIPLRVMFSMLDDHVFDGFTRIVVVYSTSMGSNSLAIGICNSGWKERCASTLCCLVWEVHHSVSISLLLCLLFVFYTYVCKFVFMDIRSIFMVLETTCVIPLGNDHQADTREKWDSTNTQTLHGTRQKYNHPFCLILENKAS